MMPSRHSKLRLWGGRKKTEDLPDDPVKRCGYFFLSTGPNDVFIPCCSKHDDDYGDKQGKTRLEVDRQFYTCMLDTAGDNRWLRLKAGMYYRIVRSIGWMFW